MWLVSNQSHRETDPWFLTHYEVKISSLRMDRKEGIESGAKCVVKWGAQEGVAPVTSAGDRKILVPPRLCPHMVGVSSGYF